MHITVVTICLNEEKNIRRTIESIVNQVDCNFEYVVCDGESKDNTLNILSLYADRFKERNILYRISSQKDGGIYKAMNRGVSLAEGQFTIFINAGDCLYSNTVIKDLISFIDANPNADVIYGNCAFVERGFEQIRCAQIDGIAKDMTVFHPAVLVRTALMKDRGFDTDLSLAADYELILYLKRQNYNFVKWDNTVSRFFAGGTCTTNFHTSFNQRFIIWQRYGIKYNEELERRKEKKLIMAYRIKNLVPNWLWQYWKKRVKKAAPYIEEYT